MKRRVELVSQLPIRPSDFVVEIGAGPTPFAYTKLIIDKYPFDNDERYNDIVNIAPVIKADAVKLPLANKSCDVLFVSHVIEHLSHPELFIEEAKRCARYVYLEFPTARRELMHAWPFHKWLVENEAGRLVFYRNDIPQIFGDFFHTHYDFLFDLWSEGRFEELNSYLYVEADDLAYTFSEKTAFERVLERSAKGDEKINYRSRYGQTGRGTVRYSLSSRLKMTVWALTPERLIQSRNRFSQRRNRSKQHKLTNDIVSRLLCQRCRVGKLRLEGESSSEQIVCESCGKRYTANNGVFDLDI